MAIINCPECNQIVSDSAKTCPHCGFAVSEATNNIVRIKIDTNPQVAGLQVSIRVPGTNRILTYVKAGAVAEIKTDEDLRISFCGLTGMSMLETTVSPKNGGKYLATWGPGFFSPKIIACSKVDVIDS